VKGLFLLLTCPLFSFRGAGVDHSHLPSSRVSQMRPPPFLRHWARALGTPHRAANQVADAASCVGLPHLLS